MDCIVFKGLDSINKMLDHILQLKREPKKTKSKKMLKIIDTYLLIKDLVSIFNSF